MNNENLKPLPSCMSKQRFFKAYFPMGQRFLSAEINRIILENRRLLIKRFETCTDDQLKKTQTIFQQELLKFVEIYGLPEGYTYPPNYTENGSKEQQ